MASGSGNDASPSLTDLVVNSSLTATASEFVPNSANRARFPKKMKNTKGFSSGSQEYSREKNADTSHQENGLFDSSGRDKYGHSSSYQSRQEFPSSSRDGYFTSHGPSKSNDNRREDMSSRPSMRFSGKYQNSQKRYPNRDRKDWGQSSSNYYEGGAQEEGAFGGEERQTYYSNEYTSGSGRIRDKDVNRDGLERNSNKSHFNQKTKVGESRTQNRDDFQTNTNRGFEKNRVKHKDRSKPWDGSNSRRSDRDPPYYSEEGPSERYFSHNSARSQDHDQDKYHFNHQNRRYGDRFPEKYRDDRSYGNRDQDSRNYDRGYSSRNRHQYDFSKDEQNRRRADSSYYWKRESSQNFNSEETFGSDSGKYLSKDFGHDQMPLNSGRKESDRSSNSNSNQNMRRSIYHKDGDDVSQRERLTEQLSRGTLECLVCCERVRQQDSVWSCCNCYHVLHLKCVMKWAKSSKAETGWRCPACQNVTETIPSQYRCFCGKILEPLWNRQDTPHTCGEVCGKSREGQRLLCTHRCTLLCHPGPCPPCVAQVVRNCGCGKSSQTVKCGLDKPLLCESTCEKMLSCGAHLCEMKCHSGPCEPCHKKIEQACFCRKQKREVDCIVENQGIFEYSCNEICGSGLMCGNHSCQDICHPEECKPCQLTPDIITHCPCGKTELSSDPQEKRKSCLDLIPTCGKICSKKLACGQPSNPHTCKSKCHSGACPSCPLTTMVRCRCGYMDRELPCDQLTTKADDARCDKKCTKKRSCAKHKCNQLCCIEIDHPCPLPCNHTLSCGLHRCEQLCHRGHCQPCWRTSFEELFCECGAEVIYPPVPCGTKPPACNRPCSRQHDCEHPALHTCHSDANCPPCTVLTQKYCYGNHELRKSIPCHQKEFSCGLPCNKELPCGRHKCVQLCHKGDCVRDNAVCVQLCVKLRPTCQHPCSAPCHDGPCPDTPCKETIRVTCECGHRSLMRPCAENTKEYQRIATSLLASKMADVQLGHSIDIGDIMGNASTRKLYWKSLECNDECKVIERNRRMAIGLQIRNPDISQKLTPRYSDFMRGWAKKDPVFCQYVHDKLTELVKLAKESKQKSRSHSFEVMNREKRQFIHEYCEHFGCESVAYDQEPKRNVVATAQKTKAWLPSVGLLEIVQREAGQRRVPGPMLNTVKKSISGNMDTLSNKWVTKPVFNGLGSSNSVLSPISSSSNSLATHSAQFNPSDGFGEGNSSGSSYIDHFNS